MISTTSYFNKTVLKKDIIRFAPLWVLYGIVLCIALPGALDKMDIPYDAAMELGASLNFMAAVNFLYAFLCAAALFGDLFVPRLCYALHAMPLRREGWFFTHAAAGALFSLVPNLAASVLCLFPLGVYWPAAFAWFGGTALQFIFFFSVAVLCAMCTGKRMAMGLLYGILNFLFPLIFWFAGSFYEPLLPGISLHWEDFSPLSPVYHMASRTAQPFLFLDSLTKKGWFSGGGWDYLTILACAGLGFLVLSLFLYKKRKLECTGDFIAFRCLDPVFIIFYSLAVGLVFYSIGEIFIPGFGLAATYGFLALGIFIGCVTGQMLLRKSLRVFNPRTYLQFGCLTVFLAVSLLVTRWDPAGITRRIPDPEKVAYVSYSGHYLISRDTVRTDYINIGGQWETDDPDLTDSVSADYFYFSPSYTSDDPAVISGIIDLHRSVINRSDSSSSDSEQTAFSVFYTMKDGDVLERHYHIPRDSRESAEFLRYLSKPEFILGYLDWDEYLSSAKRICFDKSNVTLEDPALIRELLTALRRDCEAGRAVNPVGYGVSPGEYMGEMHLELDPEFSGYANRHLSIYSDYTETMNFLSNHPELMEQ